MQQIPIVEGHGSGFGVPWCSWMAVSMSLEPIQSGVALRTLTAGGLPGPIDITSWLYPVLFYNWIHNRYNSITQQLYYTGDAIHWYSNPCPNMNALEWFYLQLTTGVNHSCRQVLFGLCFSIQKFIRLYHFCRCVIQVTTHAAVLWARYHYICSECASDQCSMRRGQNEC